MKAPLTRPHAEDFYRGVLTDSLLDPEGEAWRCACEVLKAKPNDAVLKKELSTAAYIYFRERNCGLYNKGRAARVSRIIALLDGLNDAIADERHWLDRQIYCSEDELPEVDPVADEAVRDILNGEPGNVLDTLKTLVARAASGARIEAGQELIKAKRYAWICLAQLYEERAARRAATSKNSDGKIDPNGPFVRFVLSVSGEIMYGDSVSPDMIDRFVDWYRDPESEADREHIATFRSYSAATAGAFRG